MGKPQEPTRLHCDPAQGIIATEPIHDHEVVLAEYLASHEHPQAVEYYLCGPPAMIKACTKMLEGLRVPDSQIAFDEF